MNIANMKYVLNNLKSEHWRAKCRYIKYYEKLNIEKNTILFESQNATKIDGNILYLMKYISSCEKYREFKIYISSWSRYIQKIELLLQCENIENVSILVFSSDEYVRALCSVEYFIIDSQLPSYFLKKEGQKMLNTWHGTPLKALGRSIRNAVHYGSAQKSFIMSDYLLYPNEYTKDIMLRDFMLENIAGGSYIIGGYPRNEAFFNIEDRKRIRAEYGLSNKRVYVFMPTWRGTSTEIGNSKNDTYLLYYLYEIDRCLTDDEVMYINIHPMAQHAKNDVSISELKHIRKFPSKYETYRFLNIADVLLTDYSSVFFDFSITGNKIVLFPYDRDEYYDSRGAYMSLEELPFPKVYDIPELMKELRSEKNYDDTEFLERFAPHENPNASQKLCDMFLLGEDTGLKPIRIADNGKENVLIYAGALGNNGITASLRNLLNMIDLDKRNYFFSFSYKYGQKNLDQLFLMNPNTKFIPFTDNVYNLTVFNRIIRELFKKKIINAKLYLKFQEKRLMQNYDRAYGKVKFDTVIHFTGYGDEMVLTFCQPNTNTAIFVHNDMVEEIKTRKIQRKDVLKYAYNNYNHVVIINEGIIPSAMEISGCNDNIITLHDVIDYNDILKRSESPIELDATTVCSVSKEHFDEVMESSTAKFISKGGFSTEKGYERLINAFAKFVFEGHDAYLVIVGGSSRDGDYEKLYEKVCLLGMEHNVILLLSVSNPYPILKACDYFILSSLYDGFSLGLAEADVLGKPVVSTNIPGTGAFMKKYGGTLVENSEEGIYYGLRLLFDGKVEPMNIDYDVYNAECLEEFENIFD